jgi:hypothetical protein
VLQRAGYTLTITPGMTRAECTFGQHRYSYPDGCLISSRLIVKPAPTSQLVTLSSACSKGLNSMYDHHYGVERDQTHIGNQAVIPPPSKILLLSIS